MSLASKQSQQGAALIVSLMILLILTIIGISSMGNSGMEERMAHNFQLNNTVFHAAETTIDTAIVRGDKGTLTTPNLSYYAPNDPLDLALNVGPSTFGLTNAELDPSGYLESAAVTSTSTITFIRYNEFCPGGGACNEFQINATANITATSSTATHNQGVSLPAPLLN